MTELVPHSPRSSPASGISLDHTAALRELMQRVGLSSFKALSRAAAVSKWQIEQLRQGRVAHMRVEPLLKISQALQIPLADLIARFSAGTLDAACLATPQANQTTLEQLQHEYQRLHTQLSEQRALLQQEFQQTSLHILESWLLQFPTAAYAAQQNPQIPATRLLPLLRPIDQLLQSWGVEAIAPVGSELPYDPHLHQLMDGSAQPGDRVKVRYAGYRQGEKLLYRAKVSPVASA
ncbi:MAG: helix-turn-helix domain-containing protein [Synechococcales cyanobacterium C42_A2020_086]|nr:helix-turn-helix domain-containing protein [Synechococcales cyanobacterium C42_A2020_086]